jgi:hypothetical protein
VPQSTARSNFNRSSDDDRVVDLPSIDVSRAGREQRHVVERRWQLAVAACVIGIGLLPLALTLVALR